MASPVGFPTTAERLKPLHVAVIANDLAAVKSLLRTGADINLRTRTGATPLMLACLFARRRIISFLLMEKASYRAKDSRGHSIRSYLKPDRRISAKFPHPMFKKILASTKKLRLRIKRDFCSPEAFKSRAKSRDHGLRDCIFYPQKGRIALLQTVSVVKAGAKVHEDKTRGCISGEGHDKPTIFAISGWSDEGQSGVISNSVYTAKVRQVCKELGFHLPKVKYNPAMELEENEGLGMACHVEKQLSVFWVEKILKSKGKHNLTKADISSLKGMRLPQDHKHAFIYLDHKPCKNCWDFLGDLGKASGIDFTAVCRPFVGHKKREKRSFCQPSLIPAGPSQRRDNVNQPQSGEEEESQDEPQDGIQDENAVPLEVSSDSENESDYDHQKQSERSCANRTESSGRASHLEETQSYVSLERKRDTPSPDLSYMEQFTPTPVRSHFFRTTPTPPKRHDPVCYPKGKTPVTRDPTESGVTWGDSLPRRSEPSTYQPRQLTPFADRLGREVPGRRPSPTGARVPQEAPIDRGLGITMADMSHGNATRSPTEIMNIDDEEEGASDLAASSPAVAKLARMQQSYLSLTLAQRGSYPSQAPATLPDALKSRGRPARNHTLPDPPHRNSRDLRGLGSRPRASISTKESSRARPSRMASRRPAAGRRSFPDLSQFVFKRKNGQRSGRPTAV